ncbi:hypothetical protein CSC74_08065 [Pseudoxanthomonas yeongjuensis]|nr:hypothetical protein CSC74_08065 [Pseudoxanthomonas yeongjuensis]
MPLIRPAIALEVAYAHYGALKKLYPDADEYAAAAETSASIELDGLSQLRAFSDFMTMLSKLVDIAETITAARTEVSSLSDSGIWISSIESGSPIKIVFRGSAKTIGLLLAMLKDLVRTPYLLWSKQGNLIQTMETYTMMRDLGIDDPIVVANVRDAIRKTSQRYSESFGDGSEMDLKINGETLSEARPLNQLALENPTPSKEDNGQKLLETNHGDEEDESK